MNVFIQTYIGHGGNIVNKNPIIHPSPPRTDHVANAAKLRNAVGNANQMAPQIIFIIMSNRDSFLYERLKRCMECRFGMVSQMIAVNHCRKAAPQYCSNVSMKVNAKLVSWPSFLVDGVVTDIPRVALLARMRVQTPRLSLHLP